MHYNQMLYFTLYLNLEIFCIFRHITAVRTVINTLRFFWPTSVYMINYSLLSTGLKLETSIRSKLEKTADVCTSMQDIADTIRSDWIVQFSILSAHIHAQQDLPVVSRST